jgi:hypothetical protein
VSYSPTGQDDSETSRFAAKANPAHEKWRNAVNRFRTITLTFVFVILTATFSAADIYIAQNAVGGNTGADCADAHAASWFNSTANWGSGQSQIGPGTTVHLCGTFNAPAGANGYLTFQGSGNSTSGPITLQFESGAVLTAPYWGTSGAIATGGTNSYLVVDGVCTASLSTGQCTSTQGTIQATLDGSPGATCPGGACQYQQNGFAVNLSTNGNCNNCEIKNLTISDMYVHTAASNDSGGNNAIELTGNNVSIDNNIIHDTCWAINAGYTASGTANISVFNNTVYNIDHGVAVGDSGNASLSGLYVYGNIIHDFSNWDTAGDFWHHDGIHVYANNSSTLSAPIAVYNNYIYGNWGNNFNAGTYIEVAVSGSSIGQHYIFNNIYAPSAGTSANGSINDKVNGTCGSFFNNDGVSGGNISTPGFNYGEGGGACTGGYVENSIFAGTGTNGNIGIYALNARPTSSDYNVWYNTYFGDAMYYSTNGLWFVCVIHKTGCAGASAWDLTTGFDSHSTTNNPVLTSISTCSSGTATGCGLSSSSSAAYSSGTNLYATCNGQPNPGLGALCYDYAGNQRSQSGNWDIGAYAFNSTGAPPSPPTGLTASVE